MARQDRPSLEELARRLKECAEKLKLSAQLLKMAAGQQHEHLERLNDLNERITNTLAALRATEQPPPLPPPRSDNSESSATSFNFIDLTQYLSRKDDKHQRDFPRDMNYVEALAFASYNEFLRFRGLPRISEQDLAQCDIDLLLQQLLM